MYHFFRLLRENPDKNDEVELIKLNKARNNRNLTGFFLTSTNRPATQCTTMHTETLEWVASDEKERCKFKRKVMCHDMAALKIKGGEGEHFVI